MFEVMARMGVGTDGADGAIFDGLMLAEHAHRVANDMMMAIAEMEACRMRAKDAGVARTLAQAIDRLHCIAGVQRRLARPMEGEVELAAVLADLCEAVLRARTGPRRIDLDVRMEETRVGSRTAWRLATVVAELVTNALKHGLAGRDGRLTLSLERRCQTLICVVADDGVGAGDWRSTGSGLGTRIVDDIVEEMGGFLERRSSTAGTSVRIVLPQASRTPASDQVARAQFQ